MKKLTITTMALASLALCANAGTDNGFISGTTFAGYINGGASSTELLISKDDLGSSESGTFWLSETEDGSFIVSNINTQISGVERPAKWADSEDTNVLLIDTDKPLLRNINIVDGLDATPISFENESIYFDSLVQFTSTWTAPTPTEEVDKLIVWLYGSEGVSEEEPGLFGEIAPITNVVVTAAEYDEDTVKSIKNYKISGININSGEWCRLTIKACSVNVGGFTIPSFKVYINGTEASGAAVDTDTVTVFNSLVPPAIDDAWNITSVGFEGTGAVDDLVFTTTDPMEVETSSFTVTFIDENGMAMSNVASYYFDDDSQNTTEIDFTSAANATINVPVTVRYITFKVEISDGYKLDGGDSLGASSEGYSYWTKTISRSDASVTLNVVEDTTGGDTPGDDDEELPTLGGEPVDADKLIANANSQSEIVLPGKGAWDVDGNVLKKNGVVFAEFANYYTVTIGQGGTINLALNNSVKPQIVAEEGKEAIKIDGNNITINVGNVNNNLYYGVWKSTTPNGEGVWTWSEVKGQVPSVQKPDGNCGFFKVKVSDVAQ